MEKRNFYTQTDACKTFLWALLVPQVLALLIAIIFSYFYKTSEELSASLVYLFVATIVAQLAFALVIFLYNKKNNINFIKATNLKTKNLSAKNILICVCISMIAVFGLYNFINMFGKVFIKLGFPSLGVSLPNNTIYWFIINVVLLAIVPAFFEELIFRGMIFNGLRKSGFWFASLISALMFTLVHMSIHQMIFPFIMGVVFALILEKTGSLFYTIITHFCNNFIVLLITYISNISGKDFLYIDVKTFPMALLVTFIALVALAIIWLLIKFVLTNKNEQETNKKAENLNILQEDDANDLTNVDKKRQYYKYLIGAIASGVIIWLVYVISEFVA